MSHVPDDSEVLEGKIEEAINRGELCEGCLKYPYEVNNDCEVTMHPTEETEEGENE